ncbi:hypothetical protein [Rhizobium sp. EC-SD404]|uniref:hypothetical protein n=1 Tax=Rhizobium sp. EC-SD404 TaxID=2038389 RepID=UPI0012533E53|nr:hypothetical protein [Rhizobium sp. EC-SD404]VVT16152.1 hypothetical protein RHIZ404_210297 [Rhizobium sp. EC-SD404]
MENCNDRSSSRLQAANGFIVAAIIPTFAIRQRPDANIGLLRAPDGKRRWFGTCVIIDNRKRIHDAGSHGIDRHRSRCFVDVV